MEAEVIDPFDENHLRVLIETQFDCIIADDLRVLLRLLLLNLKTKQVFVELDAFIQFLYKHIGMIHR